MQKNKPNDVDLMRFHCKALKKISKLTLQKKTTSNTKYSQECTQSFSQYIYIYIQKPYKIFVNLEYLPKQNTTYASSKASKSLNIEFVFNRTLKKTIQRISFKNKYIHNRSSTFNTNGIIRNFRPIIINILFEQPQNQFVFNDCK